MCKLWIDHLNNNFKKCLLQRNCQGLGTNLASVRDDMEKDFLLSLVPDSTHCWIDGHDGEQVGIRVVCKGLYNINMNSKESDSLYSG